VSASRRLGRNLDVRLDQALDGCGISGAQLELLDLLMRDRNAHAAALARALGIRRQSASGLITRLRAVGLVEVLPIDHGVRVPVITQDGRRRRERAHEAMAPILRTLEAALDLDDRAWFVDTAAQLDSVLRTVDDASWRS
jgi:DNA-binding MarR family transcriptional regulator